MKTTEYFRDNVIVKRPYIQLVWCERVIASPLREEHQPLDGRWRMWGYIAEVERYLRVVTLAKPCTMRFSTGDLSCETGL